MNLADPLQARDAAFALDPGRNCWRIERADRASLIVDAADYFAAARAAMLEARRRIMLIGWDFDTRIHLADGEGEEAPAAIGDFILWIAERRPDIDIYILRWDFGALKALFRGSTPITVARWALHDRIHLRLDGAHPLGASHHQKIVVVDDCLAFCGGIDMTGGRWDTREHKDRDPRRTWPNGKLCDPWHDATLAVEGPAAAALGELARDRWACAGGERLEPIRRKGSCWPDAVEVQFRDVEVAISRTRPEHDGREPWHEIEALYVDLIERAQLFVYAESQYFASRRIAEAIAARLAEPDGPELVLINPKSAWGWLESEAMDSARARLHETLTRLPGGRRFRIYHPVTDRGEPIYVHAKIMVVDDEVLRVGSANWNNRSMRLDTECDIAIDTTLAGNGEAQGAIARLRTSLLAEHLGSDPERVAAVFEETGSLIATIERLRGPGRSLRDYVPKNLSSVEAWMADHEALDPEGPGALFEPIGRRPLLDRRSRR